jgi:o-succinylbenzoate---CoA ligase
MTYRKDLETIRSKKFWDDTSCHVAAGGLAFVESGDGCVVFQTSGSTAEGKRLLLGKNALLTSARAVNAWLDVDVGSVWGLALPVSHVGGFGVAARAYAADCGLSSLEGKWDAARFLEWVERDAVTHVSLVPTQVHDLLAAGLKGGSSLRAVVVGGGRLPDEAGQAARAAGWPVLASYGMTEACSQVATQRMDSLNKPFADCPLELLPIWEAEETAEGLLRLKGDALFTSTLERGQLHRRVGEWFTTSDRAEVSGRTIRPLGRADSMVKVLGELVDVEAVESRLIEICAGRADEVAVVAMPDERKEHSLVAVFGGDALPAAVDEYNSRAPGPERIARWCVVAEFPRTGLGKLRRAELREMCGGGEGEMQPTLAP